MLKAGTLLWSDAVLCHGCGWSGCVARARIGEADELLCPRCGGPAEHAIDAATGAFVLPRCFTPVLDRLHAEYEREQVLLPPLTADDWAAIRALVKELDAALDRIFARRKDRHDRERADQDSSGRGTGAVDAAGAGPETGYPAAVRADQTG
jgi:hypothetical protein